MFDRKPIDLAALVGAQRSRLADQAGEIAGAITLIDSALSRIGRGEPLNAATFCSLIRGGENLVTDRAQPRKDVVYQYYTPEQQTEWRERMIGAIGLNLTTVRAVN